MGFKSIWDGKDLPPVGCQVLAHLSRENAWVRHTVASYGIRPGLSGNKHEVRVDINLEASDDPRSSKNQRALCDVRPLDWRED